MKKNGFTLLEAVLYMVILSIFMAGFMTFFGSAAKSSANTMLMKQGLETAQALLEEIQLMPYTFCDPTDPALETAANAAGCAIAQGFAPTAGQTRTSAVSPYNNVGDYAGYSMSPPVDIQGALIPGMAPFTYSVAIANAGAAIGGVPAAEIAMITISFNDATGASRTIVGYRFRHSPNAGP